MEGEEKWIRRGKMDKERRAASCSLEMDEVGKRSQRATLKSHPKSRFNIYSWDSAAGIPHRG